MAGGNASAAGDGRADGSTPVLARPAARGRAALLALLSLGVLGLSAFTAPGIAAEAAPGRAELFLLGMAEVLCRPWPGALAGLLLLPSPLRLRHGGTIDWRRGRGWQALRPALGWIEGVALLTGLLLPERWLPPLAACWGGPAGARVALGRTAVMSAALVGGLALGLLLALPEVVPGVGPLLRPAPGSLRLAAQLLLGATALHVWRPLLAEHEGLVALLGGLVSGLSIAVNLGGPLLPGIAPGVGVTAFASGAGAVLALLMLPFAALLALLARAEAGYAVARLLAAAALVVAGWPG